MVGACTNHDPVLDRVGGPLPEAGPDDGDAGCSLPPPDTGGAEIPCDVQAVLEAKCQRCHQSPPLNGAPFPLLAWQNTQGNYFDKPIYVRMHDAVESDLMPYCANSACASNFDPPVEPLTTDEKQTLLAWLTCPLPAFGATCP